MGNVGSSNLSARSKASNNDIIDSGNITPGGKPFVIDKKLKTYLQNHNQNQPESSSLDDEDEGEEEEEHQPFYANSRTNTIEEIKELDENMSSTSPSTNTNDEQSGCSGQQVNEKKKKTLPTVFRWNGGALKQQVYISGTFSNWKPIPMTKSHNDFVTIIDLPEGEHQYKFYVDGEWKYDSKLKNVDSDSGTKNNLVTVKQSDFEVFQALAKDSENVINNEQKEYSQNIPDISKPWEKITGPPVLPPHLLQVILNKDTPLSCEPTLLPEPNHVMLNHLYALSIKDGVMVLSATHRYRKKYVTTLLYKPI